VSHARCVRVGNPVIQAALPVQRHRLGVAPTPHVRVTAATNTTFTGLLSCKLHFFMPFVHKDVSPVCQGTHKVSENKTLSLFLHTQISKNGGTTELIHICVRYDVISEMWAGFTPTTLSETLLSETMRDRFGCNMVFVYISKHR